MGGETRIFFGWMCNKMRVPMDIFTYVFLQK